MQNHVFVDDFGIVSISKSNLNIVSFSKVWYNKCKVKNP